MERKEEYITQDEIDEGLEMLKFTEPAITVSLPHDNVLFDQRGEQTTVTVGPYVKFGIAFGRGKDCFLRKLSGTELKVFIAIGLHIDSNYQCFPGVDTIATETGLHRTSVMGAVEALEKYKLIDVYRVHGNANIYNVKGYFAYGRDADPKELSSKPNQSVIPTSRLGTTSRPGTTGVVAPGLPEVEPLRTEPPSLENFTVSYFYRDKERVIPYGKVSSGPWKIECIFCKNELIIKELDTPKGCTCGMHEYILLKKNPRPQVKIHPAVLLYRKLAGRDVTEDWADEVASTVGAADEDLDMWSKVIRGYTGAGWNRGNVENMLKYFRDGEIPARGKKTGGGQNGDAKEPSPPEPEVDDYRPPVFDKTDEEVAAWIATKQYPLNLT